MADDLGPSAQVARLAEGRLLVANPLLPDPNFDRTVVLLIAYSEEGALGLVLNRPSEMDVASPLPQWGHLAAEPPVVFVGGPVQSEAVICLARPANAPAEGWRSVSGDIGTFDLESDPDGAAGAVESLRIFAGYAGWGSGQLEGEIEAGAWWVVDAELADVFGPAPEELWKVVLRRQRSALRLVAYFPANPRMQ